MTEIRHARNPLLIRRTLPNIAVRSAEVLVRR